MNLTNGDFYFKGSMVNSILVVKLKFDNHAKKKKKNYEMPSNMLSEI